VQTSLTTFRDIPEKLKVFSVEPATPDEEAQTMLELDSSRTAFTAYVTRLEKQDALSAETFKSLMKEVQQETGVKGKQLWMPLRIALTGEMHGPELGYIAEYLGKEENIKRIKRYLS